MREGVERRVKLLVENQSTMVKGFKLEHSLTNAVVAASFAGEDKLADADLIKESRKLLKRTLFRIYLRVLVYRKKF